MLTSFLLSVIINLLKQTIGLKQMNTQNQLLRSLIKATKGNFFSIHFITKKGEVRELIMRDGVESYKVHPNGEGSNRQEAYSNLITLFDVHAQKYKSVNLDTVYFLKCGNVVNWSKEI